jgi:UDP-3-O-[3-hydroxymyristoyl] N-acetylglucosamine deacetylase
MINNYPIYVVDDERSICDSLEGIFSDEGYNIETCLDAKTLFEKAAQKPPALVLLDIWLPDIDGLEVLNKLREEYPETAVIMMSGHAGITSAVTAIKKGASDFLEKPLNMDVLLEKVSNALKTHGKKDFQVHLPDRTSEHKEEVSGAASLVESDKPQRTLKGNIVLQGTGLMSGRNTGVILSPLEENMGIIFETLDGHRIPAKITSLENYLSDSQNQTFTANSTVLMLNNSRIRTVEHLMAAFHMFELSNVLVKVDEEIPNVDGSAEDFCRLIKETGTVNQKALSKKIIINEKICVGTEDIGEKYICAEPYDELEISMRINYPPLQISS